MIYFFIFLKMTGFLQGGPTIRPKKKPRGQKITQGSL